MAPKKNNRAKSQYDEPNSFEDLPRDGSYLNQLDLSHNSLPEGLS